MLVGGHPGEFEGEHPLATARRVGNKQVFLAGWRPHEELPQALNAADALVLPSVSEAFGLVLVEAMACGLPVIASRAHGPAAIVADGRTGWLEAHARGVHGIAEVAEAEIGRRGSRRETVAFAWEHGELGASFRCRHCPDGLNRYLVEVEQEEPSEGLLGLAGAHFRDQHGRPLDPNELWHAGNHCEPRVATFLPTTPQLGASILCALCPEGMNRIYISEPPTAMRAASACS